MDKASPSTSLCAEPPRADIPDSFFDAIGAEGQVLHKLGSPPPSVGWQPQKAMYWYDSIIDWMFAHPGGALKQCAIDLGRSPVTIGLIVRSDIFKSRYAARRARFSEDLDHRLVGKLAKVAEIGLDLTLEVLEKKRDSVPLPLLNDITKSAMDRLGYGASAPAAPAVVIHNTNASQTVLPESVSPEALVRARAHLALLQGGTGAKLIENSPSEAGEVKALASGEGEG